MVAITSYPSGFRGGALLKEVPLFDMIAGDVFWVDSGSGGAGNPGTFNKPLDTVAGAFTKATAANGDYIFIKPGHAETVTATNMDLNKSGVTVVCTGNGENQAVFTFGAAAATIDVSAADVTWIGGVLKANFLDVASAFTLGASKSFTFKDAKCEDLSATLNFLSVVTTNATDNDSDDMTVSGINYYALNTTPLAFVSILAAELRPQVLGCNVDSAATNDVGHFITLAAKVVNGARFEHNELVVIGATDAAVGIFLTGSGTSTGIVAYNLVSSLDTTGELIATATTGLVFHENYYTGVADKSGKLWPVVDAA